MYYIVKTRDQFNNTSYHFYHGEYPIGSASLNLAGDTYTGYWDTHPISFDDEDDLLRQCRRRDGRAPFLSNDEHLEMFETNYDPDQAVKDDIHYYELADLRSISNEIIYNSVFIKNFYFNDFAAPYNARYDTDLEVLTDLDGKPLTDEEAEWWLDFIKRYSRAAQSDDFNSICSQVTDEIGWDDLNFVIDFIEARISE